MSDAATGVVRLIHIFSAVAWLGGVFLWNMVIGPRTLKNGPPQIRAPFAQAVIPAMTRFYMISGVLAILSGLVLVGMIFGWSDYASAFQNGTYGVWLGLGAVAAIGMAVVGFGLTAPAGKKMLELMGSLKGPPTAEQQTELAARGKKLGILGMVAMLLGTLALVGMVLATNLGRVGH